MALDDKQNEYVWIEVPKTEEVYKETGLNVKKFTEEVYTKIEKDLNNYAKDYASYYGSDVWYKCIDSDNDKYIKEREIYSENETKTNKDLTDKIKATNTGCGLTYNEYYKLKNTMLKSVYENGGD